MTYDEKTRLLQEAPAIVARAIARGWIRLLTFEELQARDFQAQRGGKPKTDRVAHRP